MYVGHSFVYTCLSIISITIIYMCTLLSQGIFGGIEQMFVDHLRTQLVQLGITNDGSTQHG